MLMRTKNYIEKLFFISISFLFSCTYFAFMLIHYLSYFFVKYINKSASISYNENGDLFYLLWFLFFYIIFAFLKIFLFQIFWKIKKHLPYIHFILNNFLNNKKLRIQIFKKAFLTDFCFFFIPTLLKSFNFENCDDFWLSLMQGTLFDSFFEAFNISLLIYVFSLGGVTTSYISFLLINRCYDLSKKNN